MRVIAGSARRLLLQAPEGRDTRPTTDRIKETLFNILAPDLYGCHFLDLFAGSGQMGIEALSRGAAEAYFAEYDKKVCTIIENNLVHTHLKGQGHVLNTDAVSAVRRLESRGKKFDFIFMDPPYKSGSEFDVLSDPALAGILKDNSLIIVEGALDRDYSQAENLGYTIVRIKEYKTNKHVFLRRQS